MTKTAKLWFAWGLYYLLCAILGFISNPQGVIYGLLFLISLGFFVPGGMLVFHAFGAGDQKTLRIVRLISLLSLGFTVVLILLNFMTAQYSSAVGTALYWLLIIVSTPMVCSQVWIVSLFGWAFLLMASITYLKKK